MTKNRTHCVISLLLSVGALAQGQGCATATGDEAHPRFEGDASSDSAAVPSDAATDSTTAADSTTTTDSTAAADSTTTTDSGSTADATVTDTATAADTAVAVDTGTVADTSTADTGPTIGPAYPVLDSYAVKAITPDSADPATLVGHGVRKVKLDLPWYVWESTRKASPCASNEQAYDGYCYRIDSATDGAIKKWTSLGVVVSAAIWGVPAWARVDNCSPYTADPWFQNFCAPKKADDFARFAGMLAKRYNGGVNGRIADFIIHNEVNHNIWYDVGCGLNAATGVVTACSKTAWIESYAASFDAAYDRIKAQQSEAKVLIPFDQNFGKSLTNLKTDWPLMGAEEFIEGFAPLAGSRQWIVAYHPYPKGWSLPGFDAKDLPYVTFGNVGVIVGHLMAKYPTKPHAWEVQLTEQGINSGTGSSETQQDTGLCNAHRNVLGTPNITSFILYRYKDNGALEGGSAMGLVRPDNSFKPSWYRWAAMNKSASYDCGFEDLPYTILKRGYRAGSGHWASTRIMPSGFAQEGKSWKLFRDKQPGTVMVFECARGAHNFLTLDQSCGGEQPLGPVGWIYTAAVSGSVALYACVSSGGADHMISPDPGCEVYDTVGLLGYALPGK